MAYGDQPTITVDGIEIPLLGFGTWQLEPADARRMVAEALRIGYRHIDTAWIYKNEKAVGDGIADAVAEGVPTTAAVRRLAGMLGVEAPIATALYQILFEGRDRADRRHDQAAL